MSAVRVAIAGAGGRMGQALIEAASSTEGVALGAAVDLKAGQAGDVTINTDLCRKSRAYRVNPGQFPTAQASLHELVPALFEEWQLPDIVDGQRLRLILIAQRLLSR